jgi:hypothetical protein
MSLSEIENAWIGKYWTIKRPQALNPAAPSQTEKARGGAGGEIVRIAALIVARNASYTNVDFI